MGTTDETVTISRETYEVLLTNYQTHLVLRRALAAQAPMLSQEQETELSLATPPRFF